MRLGTLVLRGLVHRRRQHVGILLGVAVSAAVLVGALLVGDAARHTLHVLARQRLGRTEHALVTPGRFFAASLAGGVEQRLRVPVAPVLSLRGMAVVRGAGGVSRQVNAVAVLGVDEGFSRFQSGREGGSGMPLLHANEVALNAELAAALGAVPGDSVSLRLGTPSLLPREAPLAARGERDTLLLTATVAAIVPASGLGDFSLENAQRLPRNAFVALGWLQQALGREGLANTLLVAGDAGGPDGAAAATALREAFRPHMVGLRLTPAAEGRPALLESERIFLEPAASSSALAVPGAVGVLTYLVNAISLEKDGISRSTPYSFVSAISPSADAGLGPVPAGMRDDEIILNAWTAERLGAAPGSVVTLAYFEIAADGAFVERSRAFTVRTVIGMDQAATERALVPAFPGLTDVDSCRDWRIGMPLDESRLRDQQNEAYWKRYRSTPKAFVTLAAGQAMWANRWGDLTAVRFPAGTPAAGIDALAGGMDPAGFGLVLQPVRARAVAAVEGGVDLGGLFLGMSVFLVVAALVLTSLLFVFGVESRAGETGTLLALGMPAPMIAAAYLGEAGVVALVGSVVGALCGYFFAFWLLYGLGTLWSGAVAGTAIALEAEARTLAVGGAAAFFVSVAAMGLTLRRQLTLAARALIADAAGQGGAQDESRRPGWLLPAAALLGAVVAALVVARALSSAQPDPSAAFFGAGSLLLLSVLLLARWFLGRIGRAASESFSLTTLGLRNVGRRPSRSLAVIALLASGSFILVAVAATQDDPAAGAGRRSSGGGGFALYAESVLPLRGELVAAAVVKDLPAAESARQGLKVLPIRVRDGDDASCFNLNRAQAPRLLGVQPGEFSARDAFVPPGEGAKVWGLLATPLPAGIVPGLVGDSDTARWNLRVKTGPAIGDEIEYRDERGAAFRVRLVGALPVRKTIFQGAVLIALDEFGRRFPSEDGARLFLLDAPAEHLGTLRESLGRDFARSGLEASTPEERLAAFFAVERAYREIFLLLGGLGLLVGTCGLGVVVLRNIQDRRAETALLGAVGLTRQGILRLLFAEHFALFAAGLLAGILPAGVAVLPALRSPGDSLPLAQLGGLFVALLAAGAVCTLVAACAGLRGSLVSALREG